MEKLLIATNNQGKVREILALLRDLPIELVTPNQVGLELEVEERGNTYAENAALKGRAFARASGLVSLADDSGLEVFALGNAPGLHSARYSPLSGASDADRRDHLLKNLIGLSHPWNAQFRCTVAVAAPSGDVSFTEGICQGVIIQEERGRGGFGYDPIFLIPEIGKTMAELSMEEKNRLSHRARAVDAARPVILTMLSGIMGQ